MINKLYLVDLIRHVNLTFDKILLFHNYLVVNLEDYIQINFYLPKNFLRRIFKTKKCAHQVNK